MMSKLQVHSIAELLAYALREGLLDPQSQLWLCESVQEPSMIMGSSVPAAHAQSKFVEIKSHATFEIFVSNRQCFLHPGCNCSFGPDNLTVSHSLKNSFLSITWAVLCNCWNAMPESVVVPGKSYSLAGKPGRIEIYGADNLPDWVLSIHIPARGMRAGWMFATY